MPAGGWRHLYKGVSAPDTGRYFWPFEASTDQQRDLRQPLRNIKRLALENCATGSAQCTGRLSEALPERPAICWGRRVPSPALDGFRTRIIRGIAAATEKPRATKLPLILRCGKLRPDIPRHTRCQDAGSRSQMQVATASQRQIGIDETARAALNS